MTTWDNTTVRQAEAASIRAFVESAAADLTGHVLDYGCGKQPYRDIVEAAGGMYVGYDRIGFPANVSAADLGPDSPLSSLVPAWDAILCNQVIQYLPRPLDTLRELKWSLLDGGALVLTGPTNWAEVEPQDLCRFTLAGICDVLHRAGFTVDRAERRAVIDLNGFQLATGYGVVARA